MIITVIYHISIIFLAIFKVLKDVERGQRKKHVMVKLTDSEAWSMGAVSPSSWCWSSSAAAAAAAEQRGHVASLTVVDAAAEAAAHLADGRREHHPEPVHRSSCSSCTSCGGAAGDLCVSWPGRDQAEGDEPQRAAESRPRHLPTLPTLGGSERKLHRPKDL